MPPISVGPSSVERSWSFLCSKRTPSSVLFIIPWGDYWLLGTTDTSWTLDRAHPAASSRDIDYLLEQANQALVDDLRDKAEIVIH